MEQGGWLEAPQPVAGVDRLGQVLVDEVVLSGRGHRGQVAAHAPVSPRFSFNPGIVPDNALRARDGFVVVTVVRVVDRGRRRRGGSDGSEEEAQGRKEPGSKGAAGAPGPGTQ